MSSGRAAIFWALRLLGVREGDAVLVPSYHCPTLVAPVVAIGATPVFYALTPAGLPDVQRIGPPSLAGVSAMVVAQLFGIPLDLSEVREWCDRRGIALVEDCAHSLFGRAGDRMAGEWGDYGTWSLTKFLPVGELGYLLSSRHPVPRLDLARTPMRWQVRAVLDPIQAAARHGRLGWIGAGVTAATRRPRASGPTAPLQSANWEAGRLTIREAMQECDMARVRMAPAAFGVFVALSSDLPAIAARRRQNYRRMTDLFGKFPVGRPLADAAPEGSGPYVLPVLVDDPDSIYPAMRHAGFPVYRWDRQWPGTTTLEGDIAAVWRSRLLQIPVHQSYTDEEFERLAGMLEGLMSSVGRTR